LHIKNGKGKHINTKEKTNKQKVIEKFKNNRNCNGCTKCCEGWLSGNIYGYKKYTGRPCHFVKSDGCSIYKKRPQDPCRSFKCEWLINLDIPEWLYPKESKVIIKKENINNIPYLRVVEAGEKLSVEILNWLLLKYINDGTNIVYHINNGKNWIGSKEFVELIEKNEKK